MLNNNKELFLWGALIGGLIGATATLLLTPTSGDQLRNYVTKHLNGHVSHSKHTKPRTHKRKKVHSKE